MDEDRPERTDWLWPLDILGWLWSLPGRALAALHRFCHRWEPKCPDCAAKQKLADEWAGRCRAEEAAHKATVERLTVTPGTPIFGGGEEGPFTYFLPRPLAQPEPWPKRHVGSPEALSRAIRNPTALGQAQRRSIATRALANRAPTNRQIEERAR